MLLSQLFFDNTQFYRFVEDCRITDINVPIVPGIMPVINAAQIKRMITMCGASFPERFQKIIHKFEDNKEALFDAGMSYALSQIIDLLANDTDGIHLYTMNNPVFPAGSVREFNILYEIKDTYLIVSARRIAIFIRLKITVMNSCTRPFCTYQPYFHLHLQSAGQPA